MLLLFDTEKTDRILPKKLFLFSDAALLDDANAEAGNIQTHISNARHKIFMDLDMTVTPPDKNINRERGLFAIENFIINKFFCKRAI